MVYCIGCDKSFPTSQFVGNSNITVLRPVRLFWNMKARSKIIDSKFIYHKLYTEGNEEHPVIFYTTNGGFWCTFANSSAPDRAQYRTLALPYGNSVQYWERYWERRVFVAIWNETTWFEHKSILKLLATRCPFLGSCSYNCGNSIWLLFD